MNCQMLNEHIDDYISGNIVLSLANSIKLHSEECSECATSINERKQLIALLNNTPKVYPAPDLAAKILSQRQAKAINSKWLWFGTGLGSSIAAGILLFVVFFNHTGLFETTILNQVSIRAHETSPVNILVNSEQQIDDVKFSVILPPIMKLQGYGKRQSLAWLGRLKQGRNLLSLPIMSSEGNGTLTMRIEHRDLVKEYKLMINVTNDQNVNLFTPINMSRITVWQVPSYFPSIASNLNSYNIVT